MRSADGRGESGASARLNVSERTCCNISTFVGEMASSHNSKRGFLQISTALKIRLRLGYTHEFATSEQFRSNLSSCGGM